MATFTVNRPKKYHVGDDVMSRGNDFSTPLRKGVVTNPDTLGNSSSPIPTVKFEDGHELLCFSIVLPFDQKLWDYLSTMSNEDQYEYLKMAIINGDER